MYSFNSSCCWYKDVCNFYDTDECCAACIRYLEMYHLMEQSEIPRNKQFPVILYPNDCDIDAFEHLSNIKNNIVDFVNTGKNLYLYSTNSGNGKTSWALKLMQKYFDSIWSGNGLECRGVYIHTPTLILRHKSEAYTSIKSKSDSLNKVHRVPLVIFDDIAVSEMTNHDYGVLLSWVDHRALNGLSSIFTSNFTPDRLKSVAGERLYSRVYTNAVKIELRGVDRRGDIYA